MAAAEQELATDIQSSERSLRDELLAARDEVEKRTQAEEGDGNEVAAAETEAQAAADRARDERGRFASNKPDAVAGAEAPTEQQQPEVAAQPVPQAQEAAREVPAAALAAPNSWSNQAKAKWHEIPPDIRAEIAKRESDVHKGFTKMDEERAYGRELQKVIQPYEPLIRAEGGTPAAAVQDLLNTAYILRTGDPATKARLFAQTAQRFGVDLSQLGQQQQQVAPEVAALHQRIAQLEGSLQQRARVEQERAQQTALQTIQTFKSDPAHPFFDAVQDEMALLLQNNAAADLKEAYDKAVWMRPDLRQQLLAAQTAQQTATVQQRQKVDKARMKAGSVRGGPGGTQPAAPNPNASVREDLEAAFREAQGRV